MPAALHFARDTLYYADLTQRGEGARLRRLGTCAFDFDVTTALLDPDAAPDDALLQRVIERLQDAFDASSAERLHLVVHPPDAFAFVAPTPADAAPEARRRALVQQASLLTGIRTPGGMHLTTEPLHAPPRRDATHPDAATDDAAEGDAEATTAYTQVLVVPRAVDDRLGRMVQALPFPAHRWALTTHGAGRLALVLERDYASATLALRPYSLAVGFYPTHTEYGLCHDGQWRYTHHADAHAPGDRVYFALALLKRLGAPVHLVGRLFAYGPDLGAAALAPFGDVFSVAPEPLDPAAALPADGAARATPAYAPCLGALTM
jgi:hypothetical protein